MLAIDLSFTLGEEGIVEIHLSTGPSSDSAGCACIHLFLSVSICASMLVCEFVCVFVCSLCRQRLTSELEPPLIPAFTAISVPLE